VTELVYKFTNDALFKMVFCQYPALLKHLVAIMLGVRLENITEFIITNPDMEPEVIGDKFCRLDINMIVNARRVDLEIQLLSEKSDNICYPAEYVIRVESQKSVKTAA
jgi:hypothetical protein